MCAARPPSDCVSVWPVQERFTSAAGSPRATAVWARLNVVPYADGGAERALTELKAAVEQCAGGFAASVGSGKQRVAEVTTTAAPKGLAVTLGVDIGKDANALMKVVVFRKGATIASFGAADLSSMATGADFEVPAAVIDTQIAKLG
ncbi:hypothetical protein ACFFKE_20910 [Streptomyces mutabilis]|uniref:hypothetical protein n=1 Tax=Streptomyces mutabilis TaxID=67332 RepID=UPI00177F421D|nr:hypothetical protein [Streptomyces mutabilis]GGQ06283.1 hypothetical protein GCM10010279_11970 [Streptomyces mutabilis]